MAGCTIEVYLAERPAGSLEPASYLPGEPMNVLVIVEVDEPTRCDALTLTSHVVGKGKGFSPTTVGFEERLFSGELSAGRHTYRRTLPAPQGPPTFHGHWLSWDWWVEAKADIPWAADPSGKELFILRTPPNPGPLHLELPPPDKLEDVAAKRRGAAAATTRAARALMVIGGLGLIGVVIGLFLRFHYAQPEEVWGPFLALGSLLTVLLLALPAMFTIGSKILGVRSAEIDVAVTLARGNPDADYRSAPGDADVLTCTVHTDPTIVIDSMRARFVVNEHSSWSERTGSTRRTRSFSVSQYEVAAELEPTVTPGERRCRLPLPDDLSKIPCSYETAGHDGIIWQVEIHLQHSGGKKPHQPVVRRLKAWLG